MKIPSPIRDLRPLVATLLLSAAWAVVPREAAAQSLRAVARVIISFAVAADGSVEVKDILEATDRRLLRRIQKALDEAPKWIPALKEGEGVATDHVLRITLPKGRQLPRERVVLIR